MGLTTPTVFDSEVFCDLYLASFKRGDRFVDLLLRPGQTFPADRAEHLLRHGPIHTFNGKRYDMPLLSLAMQGATCEQIKAASDRIIQNNVPGWKIADAPPVNRHVDLFELIPGMASLKELAARLHYPSLREYHGDFAMPVGDDPSEVIDYCHHDLGITQTLGKVLEPQIATRIAFDPSLESLSEPAIARRLLTEPGDRGPGEPFKSTFRYTPPAWMRASPILDAYLSTEFGTRDNGHTSMPESLAGLSLGPYRFGLGGIHSTESCRTLRRPLIDADVTSYYPAILLGSGRFKYADRYREIMGQRIAAKRGGRDAEAAVFKIVLNSTYGHLGNMWSPLYDPELQMYVTITGQLAILMLIEDLTAVGCTVVSANTDGVTFEPSPMWQLATDDWQATTGFNLEFTHYSAMFSRDVNSYVAVKEDGSVKRKGFFTAPSLAKNPSGQVAIEAAIRHLTTGEPIELDSDDIRDYLFTRKVAGGAHLDGVPLGKVVRFYHSIASPGCIKYVTNNYKVGNSDGAVPLITLPSGLPPDLDHASYLRMAQEIVKGVGA